MVRPGGCAEILNTDRSLVTGMSIILFVHSIRALLRKRRRHDALNRPLVICAPLLFFFATLVRSAVASPLHG